MRFIPATNHCEQCGLVFSRKDKPGLALATFRRLRFCSYTCSNKAHEYGPAKFLSFFDSADVDACWEWTGPRTGKNYGIFHMRKQRFSAHRYSYELFNGPIPNGLHILHQCDNPPCVNPTHLHIGTHQQNMREAKERNRFRHNSGDKHHLAKLTAAQVAEIRSSNEPAKEAAERLGLHFSQIYRIRRGDQWKCEPMRAEG